MRKTECQDCKHKDFEYSVLLDENQRLTKELEERNATIRFLVKAASVIEAERDQYEKFASDEVPF
jgi:cell shape-determining protein MreC